MIDLVTIVKLHSRSRNLNRSSMHSNVSTIHDTLHPWTPSVVGSSSTASSGTRPRAPMAVPSQCASSGASRPGRWITGFSPAMVTMGGHRPLLQLQSSPTGATTSVVRHVGPAGRTARGLHCERTLELVACIASERWHLSGSQSMPLASAMRSMINCTGT